MFIDLSNIKDKNLTIGVALSGGGDSMALIHYLSEQQPANNFKIVAINVEHGIRGPESISDSNFVKRYCERNNIPLKCYAVDCPKYAKENKLTLEQSARILRYNCFYDAINTGFCNKIATAHHSKDNLESVLLNLFRGTGIKGLKGIMPSYSDLLIRPFLDVSKEQIENYLQENNIPFVEDKTNLCEDYSRNFIRLNVLPLIKQIYPEAETSVSRLSKLVREEDEFLDELAEKNICYKNNKYILNNSLPPVLFKRATIICLKKLGIEKDWAKVHIDDVFSLIIKENGKQINLPKNIVAVKEYNNVCIYEKKEHSQDFQIDYAIGSFEYCSKTYQILPSTIEEFNKNLQEKSNHLQLFIDAKAIPLTAVIRNRRNGDYFTPFGGGKRSLSDFFTDKKIPLKDRNNYPIIANGQEVLAILGLEISKSVKITKNTKNIIKLT